MDAKCIEVLQSLPHLVGLHGPISCHLVCKAPSFGDQQTEAVDEVGSRLILCSLLPSSQDFPIPAFLNPVLLILAQSFEFHVLQIVCVTQLGLAQRLGAVCRLGEHTDGLFKFAKLRVAV